MQKHVEYPEGGFGKFPNTTTIKIILSSSARRGPANDCKLRAECLCTSILHLAAIDLAPRNNYGKVYLHQKRMRRKSVAKLFIILDTLLSSIK